MVQFYQITLVLHIAFAAIWFAMGLGLAGRVRRGLALGGTAAEAALADLKRQRLIGMISAVLTFVSGLGLIFLVGGFKGLPIRLHIALGIMMLALIVEFGLIQPAVGKLSGSGAEGASKRLAAGSGVNHLLWLVLLVLMVWKA